MPDKRLVLAVLVARAAAYGTHLDLVAGVLAAGGEAHARRVEGYERDVEVAHLVARAPVYHRLQRAHHVARGLDLVGGGAVVLELLLRGSLCFVEECVVEVPREGGPDLPG